VGQLVTIAGPHRAYRAGNLYWRLAGWRLAKYAGRRHAEGAPPDRLARIATYAAVPTTTAAWMAGRLRLRLPGAVLEDFAGARLAVVRSRRRGQLVVLDVPLCAIEQPDRIRIDRSPPATSTIAWHRFEVDGEHQYYVIAPRLLERADARLMPVARRGRARAARRVVKDALAASA
jgi:hypothetical protein